MQEIQREGLSGLVVPDTAQNHVAAQPVCIGLEFLATQPDGAHNAFVQRLVRIVPVTTADEADPEVGNVLLLIRVQVHSADRFGRKIIGGFFPDLTPDRLDQRFIFLQVSGWLVIYQRIICVFFNEQESAILFNDSRHGYIGFPLHNRGVLRLVSECSGLNRYYIGQSTLVKPV